MHDIQLQELLSSRDQENARLKAMLTKAQEETIKTAGFLVKIEPQLERILVALYGPEAFNLENSDNSAIKLLSEVRSFLAEIKK